MKKLGILTVENENSFGGNRSNFRDLTRVGKQLGWEVAVIPAESIVGGPLSGMRAFVWEQVKKKWAVRSTAMPDLFYNRIPYRDWENRPVVKQAKEVLKQQQVPYFNPHFFSKDHLFRLLSSSSSCQSMLPRTEPYNLKNLASWMREETEFYIKPVHGSKGEGIIRIDRIGGEYRVEKQGAGNKLSIGIYTPAELLETISKITGRTRYLLQRAVPLPRIGNRMYDLRTLVQRGRDGAWNVTGVGARVSAENGITTHVPNGGHIEAVNVALAQSFGSESNSIYERLEEAALRIAEHIEQNTQGLIGEMSMDLGVDQEGQIWFFEANAKPMKFDEPEIRKNSLYRLFEFSDFVVQSNRIRS